MTNLLIYDVIRTVGNTDSLVTIVVSISNLGFVSACNFYDRSWMSDFLNVFYIYIECDETTKMRNI